MFLRNLRLKNIHDTHFYGNGTPTVAIFFNFLYFWNLKTDRFFWEKKAIQMRSSAKEIFNILISNADERHRMKTKLKTFVDLYVGAELFLTILWASKSPFSEQMRVPSAAMM